jgi:hypothetical protein
MRLIIAGPRDFSPESLAIQDVKNGIWAWHQKYNHKIDEIISGHSGVIDLAGESVAKEMNVKLKLFPYPNDSDLRNWGMDPTKISIRARGPVRNGVMADYAKEVPPGGLLVVRDLGPNGVRLTRGTDSMKQQALARGLLVMDYSPMDAVIGYKACWKKFPGKGNCRMPEKHKGDCAPY